MSATPFDVVGIGNAIVDVLTHCPEERLAALQLNRGAMTLIDEYRAHELYDAMGPAIEISGGSAGNTVAGIAMLGSRTAYIGKVRDDQMGEVFRHDIRAVGAYFDTQPLHAGPQTARCLIFVTPDGQRTMNTYLGACVELGPEDIDESVIARAGVTYLEGYLWDKQAAKDAFLKAAHIAHEAGREVSLSLSDSFCVDRHRESFRRLVDHHVDVLFANEAEITALFEVADFDAALQAVRGRCKVAALTRGDKGAVIVAGDEVHIIDARPVGRVVDTTGAGDLFASGFLHGYSQGRDLATCGRMGTICAAEIISHMGARPEADLAALITTALGA